MLIKLTKLTEVKKYLISEIGEIHEKNIIALKFINNILYDSLNFTVMNQSHVRRNQILQNNTNQKEPEN